VADKQFKVLLAGIGRGPFEALAPVLDRQDLDVVRVATPEDAIEFARKQPVDLVVFDGEPNQMRLDEIVPLFRAEASESAKSFLLVMAARGKDADARALVGRGVNRVMHLDEAQERIEEEVVDLLGVVPRAAARFAIRLYTTLDDGVDVAIGRTQNVSLSGMLVRTPAIIAPGQRVTYELLYDEREESVKGEAEVVRRAVRDGVEGLGVRFLDFEADGRARLDAILADIFGGLFGL
jgi:CheY-like chemotaxis protein